MPSPKIAVVASSIALTCAVGVACKKEESAHDNAGGHEPVSEVFARGSNPAELAGTYRRIGTGSMDFVALTLEPDGKCTSDEGIVCAKAPCPSGETSGEWKSELAGSKGQLAVRPLGTAPGGIAPHVYDLEMLESGKIRLARRDAAKGRRLEATFQKSAGK